MNPIVLIAEGETLFRQVISLELQDRGLTVIEATHKEEVIQRAKVDPPSLLIIDLDFPQTGAIGLLEELHKKELHFPVIVLAESTDKHTMKKCLDLGVKECLVKSEVEWEELVKKIMKYADIKKGRAGALP